MNTFVLSVSILFISIFSVYGQISHGIELGGNLMNAGVAIDQPLETKNSWGIRLGYVGEYEVSNHLYIRVAILVNQRGFQFNKERWGLNVLDVPLNIGYVTPIKKDIALFFIDGGLNGGYNMYAFTKVDGETVKISIGKGRNDIKEFSLGFNIGVGLQISDSLKARLSYYRGLTNLARKEGDEWKDTVFGLSINYFFKLKN